MHKGTTDTVRYINELYTWTMDIPREQLELFVLPSFTSIEKAVRSVPEGSIVLGAQNMCWAEEGPYTGEISPGMLDEAGARIVAIGHSERRHIFRETDREENRKVLAALAHGLTPLLCIGETAEQKEDGISDEILRQQLKQGLRSVDAQGATRLWVAYEPVWAIGANGTPAPKEYANGKHEVIKRTLRELFGDSVGLDIPVLYGGSVNRENAPEYIQMPYIDGLFIGRSAWDAKNFNAIIRDVLPLFNQKRKEGRL